MHYSQILEIFQNIFEAAENISDLIFLCFRLHLPEVYQFTNKKLEDFKELRRLLL